MPYPQPDYFTATSPITIEAGETREIEGRAMFGVASDGAFFPIAPAEGLEDAL